MKSNHFSLVMALAIAASVVLSGCLGGGGSSSNSTRTSGSSLDDLDPSFTSVSVEPETLRLLQHVPRSIEMFEDKLSGDELDHRNITLDDDVEWVLEPSSSTDYLSLTTDDSHMTLTYTGGAPTNGDDPVLVAKRKGVNVAERPITLVNLESLSLSSFRETVAERHQLPLGQSTCLTATGHYKNGETHSLTEQVQWTFAERENASSSALGGLLQLLPLVGGTADEGAPVASLTSNGCLTADNQASNVAIDATLGLTSASLTFDFVDAEVSQIRIDQTAVKQGDRLTARAEYLGDNQPDTNITREAEWLKGSDNSIFQQLDDGTLVAQKTGTEVVNIRWTVGDKEFSDSQEITVQSAPTRAQLFEVTATPNVILAGEETTEITIKAIGFDGHPAEDTPATLTVNSGDLSLTSGQNRSLDLMITPNFEAISAQTDAVGSSILRASATESYAVGQTRVISVNTFADVLQKVLVVDEGFTELDVLPPGFRIGIFLFNPSNRDFQVNKVTVIVNDGSPQTRESLDNNALPGRGNFLFVAETGASVPNESFEFLLELEAVDGVTKPFEVKDRLKRP